MAEPISVVSEAASIRGKIRGEGDLEIRGRVEGEVDVGGELVVAEGAIVRATIRAGRVVVRGAVLGDLIGSESIALEESARVVGNLTAERITIALGAQIRGELKMDVQAGDLEIKPRAQAAVPSRAQPARPIAAPVRRELPPVRSVVAHRKPPVVAAASPAPETNHKPAPPPAPVVPSIKKGAKAVAKRKGA